MNETDTDRCRCPRDAAPFQSLATDAAFEIVALRTPLPPGLPAEWPLSAGGVRWDSTGRPGILHIAADRWLMPAPDAQTLSLANGLVQSRCAAMIDVTGKWQGWRSQHLAVPRILSRSRDVEALLDRAECARLALFDCPAIIAKRAAAYWIWVQRSYCTSFLNAVGGAGPAGSTGAHLTRAP